MRVGLEHWRVRVQCSVRESHRRTRQPLVVNAARHECAVCSSPSVDCHSISIYTIIIKIGNGFDLDDGKVGAARVDTLKKIG